VAPEVGSVLHGIAARIIGEAEDGQRYDHAVKREQLGGNISLKILEPPESALDWEEKEG